MSAPELHVVDEQDAYTESLRDSIRDRAEDAREAVADLIICLGRRISGQKNRRVSLDDAFQSGYRAGFAKGKREEVQR